MHQSAPPLRRARRAARPALGAALAAAALLGLSPVGAQAAFSGSSGKIAWASDGLLKIDDPYDDRGPRTVTSVPKAESPLNSLAPTSAVSFSPDGTKIAFAKAVDNGIFPEKTAIFVADISEPPGGSSGDEPITIQQISDPYPGRQPSCGTCDDGEVTYDHAPVWTAEGEVAFIRQVWADEEAQHASESGATVRTVAVDGGSTRQVAYWPAPGPLMQSIVWPAGASEPVAIAATSTGYQLRKVASRQVLAQELGIDDLDASPDGSRIVYQAIGLGGKRIKVARFSTGEVLYTHQPAISDMGVRFTPDGTRLLLGGCAADRSGQQRCGWKTHRIADPDADVRSDEPVEQPYLDGNPSVGVGPTTAAGGRTTIDIQSQDLPVIFVPGFLGSEIQCGSERVWMPEDGPPIHLEKVALAADGKSEAACQHAAPTGREVRKFLGADVYEHGSTWLRELKARTPDPDGWYTLGWDWRKAPSESLQRVDEQITRLLARDLPTRQGAKRAAFVTHSYGSLLVRDYVDTEARARRVARVVTVGAPWWGAPKPVLPIAFGIETPEFSALDLFIRNANLRTFMVNAAGAYHLAPSDQYGPFLRLDGEQLDQPGVANFLASTGGNAALHQQARATHQRIDGFKDWNGRIDWRNVTGIGLPTVQGFNIVPLGDGNATVGLVHGQGDGTVPVRSSVQGDEGTADPLGDNVHTQYRCGVPHMRQTADEFTQRAYADFLVSGAIPRKLPHTQCAISGTKITVHRDIPLGTPSPRRAARAAESGAPQTLADAEWSHEADVIKLGGQTQIVTSDHVGGGLRFTAEGDVLDLRAITASGEGEPRRYGPLTGAVVIGGSAAAPQITVDGHTVQPSGSTPADPAPAPTPTPDYPAQPGNSGTTPRDTIGATIKLSKTVKVDRRGRILVRVAAKRKSSGRLTLTGARRQRLARPISVRFAKAGTKTVRVTLTPAARRALRRGRLPATLTLTLRAAGQPVSTATATRKLRRG